MGARPADRLISAGRQRQPPFEAALGKFETMNLGCAQFDWQDARTPHNEHAILDERLGLFQIDAWEGDQHKDLMVGFQHIGRRLPAYRPTGRSHRRKALLVQPLDAVEQIDGICPHPIA
jgi:ribosomal protein S19